MHKCLQSSHGEPTRSWDVGFISKICRSHGDNSLNAWVQPHHTNTAKSLFDCHTDQRKAEAIERMGRISDLNRVGGKCC
jgi:hypothetical protein